MGWDRVFLILACDGNVRIYLPFEHADCLNGQYGKPIVGDYGKQWAMPGLQLTCRFISLVMRQPETVSLFFSPQSIHSAKILASTVDHYGH